jgi:AcrR family transcriptional regulator
MSTTLRERKKQQTREAFIACACELFTQKGYDATTLAEIAERANCAPRTFFQYFESKEDLLLVGIEDFWNELAAALRERPDGVTALQMTREWMVKATEKFLANAYPMLQILDREAANLKLSALCRAKCCSMEQLESVLAPEIAKDLGASADSLEPKLIAKAAAAMLDSYHIDTTLGDTDPLVFIDKVFQLVDGCLKAV